MSQRNQMIESLETRRLMSATVTAQMGGDHVLTVNGTDQAETINVNQLPDGTVGVGGFDASGNPFDLGTFSCVALVRINAKGGDDFVQFSGKTVAAVIDGGDGNDNISVQDQGCVGSAVFGGNGVDTIIVDNSSLDANFNTVAGKAITTVDGGNDNDAIILMNGSKGVLAGGNGNDAITVMGIDGTQKAFAIVDGGNGNDSLLAMNATVIYSGGNGNDDLQAIDSYVLYLGGNGYDTVTTNVGSTVVTVGVESVAPAV